MRGVGEYRGRRQSSPDLKSLAPPARPQAITFSASQDHYSPSGKCLYFLPAFRKVPRGTGAAYRIRSAAERWRNISLTFSSKTAINRHRGRPLDRSPATPPRHAGPHRAVHEVLPASRCCFERLRSPSSSKNRFGIATFIGFILDMASGPLP